MRITLSSYDPILKKALAVEVRQYPAQLEFEPWYNHKINKYLRKKFQTLSKLAYTQDPRLWHTANMLMQSNSYKLNGLYAVFPTWQRHKTITFIQ